MNPSAARTIRVMRRVRIRRWRSRLRRSMWLRWILRVQFAAIVYAVGYFTPRSMELPPVGDPVIVYTATRVHVGWMDEAGEFRRVDTGERIKQVVKWARP